jgi:hypothetical protein
LIFKNVKDSSIYSLAKGESIDKDPRIIAEILGAVKHLRVHKDLTPPELYREMCDTLPRVIADGLVTRIEKSLN